MSKFPFHIGPERHLVLLSSLSKYIQVVLPDQNDGTVCLALFTQPYSSVVQKDA